MTTVCVRTLAVTAAAWTAVRDPSIRDEPAHTRETGGQGHRYCLARNQLSSRTAAERPSANFLFE
jgi:hypothetical protein